MNHQEIECRFLGIDKAALIQKLHALGAIDKGEQLLDEVMIYDQELKWKEIHRFIRLRKYGDTIKIAYKNHINLGLDGCEEIEFGIDDMGKAELLFEKIGLRPYRRQQKLRHTFILGNATIDIDTWPKAPPYVEIEGDSKETLEVTAKALDLNWEEANFKNAAWVLENVYNIPVRTLRYFTFDRYE